jgi:glycosyltransferase involved in cell wall biosynthesis
MIKKISVIIPVYNEEKTLGEILRRVEAVNFLGDLEKEIVLVNDASHDGTKKILDGLQTQHKIIHLDQNTGKGGAVTEGLKNATGDVVVIQDADLEYDPEDINILLKPVLEDGAEVVYGSRFLTDRPHRVLRFWHHFGNKILTNFSNMFSNLNLTDMETCYKLMTKEVVDDIKDKLVSKRFGIEPEITARVKKYKIYEVGISYNGRSYKDGKKIGWKDAVSAVWCIVRFNLFG